MFFVHAACFVSLLLLMSARFVRDQCLCILRVFKADMDWVEGANFLDTSDFLPLRVSSSTSSRRWPMATFRRSFRAEWLVHYFLFFGLPVSVFLTDPDVTAVAQTPGATLIYIYWFSPFFDLVKGLVVDFSLALVNLWSTGVVLLPASCQDAVSSENAAGK